MAELIFTIPEHIGWVIVGSLAMLSAVMMFKLGKMLVQMWTEWHETEEED